MSADNTKKTGNSSNNIEEILQQREFLDQTLREKFRKEVTILFTDICGYTQYIDARGDIDGRALLLKHNRILLPEIEKHEGKLIEIIGDAIMAGFSAPLSAVKAAMAIQRALVEYNLKTEPADRIQVKIGINHGEALVDEAAVYQGYTGDVANVASRVQSKAGPDEILISKVVYDHVCGSEDILCRFHGTVQLKGKAQGVQIYRVIWREEETVLSTEPKVRLYEHARPLRERRPLRVIQLDLNREGDRFRISAEEHIGDEKGTIQHYEEMRISMAWIDKRCREMVETLNKANRQGRISSEVLLKLRQTGQVLHDELFPLSVKDKIRKTQAEYLTLSVTDQLVQVPWELFNDGRKFLCQHFNMGRLVKTRQPLLAARTRALGRPFKMLLLADPAGDLQGAYSEGTKLKDYIDRAKGLINVTMRSKDTTVDAVLDKLRNFDLVHFAGHADYDPDNPSESGWRFSRGSLKAKDITKMARTGIMPSLIFSNACRSARTEEWFLKEYFQDEIFGLANAFLLSGVRHYVGSFWDILDEPSARFALAFYRGLLSGLTTGEAMRLARVALIEEFGEETILWASYVLYGDPTFNYMAQIESAEAQAEPEPAGPLPPEAQLRDREIDIDLAVEKVTKRRWALWLIAAGIIVVSILGLWGYQHISEKEIVKYQREILDYYQKNEFDAALQACRLLETKRPGSYLSALVRGNIYLKRGKLAAAEEAYSEALTAPEGTNVQRAEALFGLGRIASSRQQPDLSLEYYQQATELAPGRRMGYLSQALILESRGDLGEALNLLTKAQELTPNDQVVTALVKDIRKSMALSQDQEEQQRIDQVVKELLETMKSPPRALPSDGWTSVPLTIWVMDLEVQGYSLQEGEDRLLVSSIVDHMLQYQRLRVVERALLEKLLQELKLGTSALIDRNNALSVGRILAARLILSGQLVYTDSQTQVSMRLIETETGRITASVSEACGSAVPSSTLADKLSKDLLGKLRALYPIRGKIAEMQGENLKLNIGQNVGVRVGQRFKVLEEPMTVEVIAIQPHSSLAKITDGKGPLQQGFRLEAI